MRTKVSNAQKKQTSDASTIKKLKEQLDDKDALIVNKNSQIQTQLQKIQTMPLAHAAAAPRQQKTVAEHKNALIDDVKKKLKLRSDNALEEYRTLVSTYNANCQKARDAHAAALAQFQAATALAAAASASNPVAPAAVYAFEYHDMIWKDISDAASVAELMKLTATNAGSLKVTYSVNSNSYETEIVTSRAAGATARKQLTVRTIAHLAPPLCFKQTNISHSAHTQRIIIAYQHQPLSVGATAGAPVQPTLTLPAEPPSLSTFVSGKVLYGDPVMLDMNTIRAIHADLDANNIIPDCKTGGDGADKLADLAKFWSEPASGFTYDANKCKMWNSAFYFKAWCHMAISRKLHSVRLAMHGTSHPHAALSDMFCYDLNFAKSGLRGIGVYVSTADHIPVDYNRYSGHKDGSGFFGLVLCNPSTDQSGSIEAYKLNGRTTPLAIKNDPKLMDAIAVHDQLRWLPLGYAVAQ